LKKYGECLRKKRGKVVRPTEGKAQQCGAQERDPEGAAREGGSQREV